MTAPSQSLRERLAARPTRGLGCANQIALEAATNEDILEELVSILDDTRPLLIARAANALKKVQAASPGALHPFAHKLVHTALRCDVLEARWNLTIVVGGLPLKGKDRALAIDLLFESLGAASPLLRVFASQALADLSVKDPALRQRLRPVLEDFLSHGTAAMKARARKLLPLIGAART